MGVTTPETCWAVHKRQVINLWNCCILLVDLFESFDDARTCEHQKRILNFYSLLKLYHFVDWDVCRALQMGLECCALVLPPANSSVLCAFASTPVSALERDRYRERENELVFFSTFSTFPTYFTLFVFFQFAAFAFLPVPPIDSGSCTIMTYFIHAI
jgi:hypothetical protein